MVYKYRYKDGHGLRGIDAQSLGEYIEGIKFGNGGTIEAGHLVEASRSEDAPLHGQFEWDDTEAAKSWREHEARQILHCYVEVISARGGEERVVPALVSVYDRKAETSGYQSTRDAMRKPETRARIIARERALLDAWVERNRQFEEQAELVARIDRVRTKQKRAERQQPALQAALT